MHLKLRTLEVEAQLKGLLSKSATGDQVAYEDFLNLSSVMVKNYLLHLGHRSTGVELLEDLHQEVMMSIHQKKQTYQTDKAILPWIYAITRHRYIDFYRARKRSREVVELHDSHLPFVSGDLLELDEILSTLSPQQINMLRLVKVEGHTYTHAAQELGISEPNLKVSLHRILKSLKEKVLK